MLHTTHHSSLQKNFFQSQLTAFNKLAALAIEGSNKVIALNQASTKEFLQNCSVAKNELTSAKDPQAFFAVATAFAKPTQEETAAYGRQLADIVSTTNAELVHLVNPLMAQAHVPAKKTPSATAATANTPADFPTPLKVMQSLMENATTGYEHFFKAACDATGMEKGPFAMAANPFLHSAEKNKERSAKK